MRAKRQAQIEPTGNGGALRPRREGTRSSMVSRLLKPRPKVVAQARREQSDLAECHGLYERHQMGGLSLSTDGA